MKRLRPSRLEIHPGVWLDSRRALWLAGPRVLVVADLHLGYAWTHRQSGQLLPLSAPEDTVERLEALRNDYRPRSVALLGDIVHRTVAVAAVQTTLRRLMAGVGSTAELVFIAGNHDGRLEKLAKPVPLVRQWISGGWLLLHGDAAPRPEPAGPKRRSRSRPRIIMGHEHPCISVGDGVATSVRCPCFLVSDHVIVLPAFSRWAAGSNVRVRSLMSPLTRRTKFAAAVAILGDALLPLPFPEA